MPPSGVLAVLGVPPLWPHHCSLCFQCYVAFFSECLCVSSFLIRASVIINQGSTYSSETSS